MNGQDALDLGTGIAMHVDAETLATVLGVAASTVYKFQKTYGMPKDMRGNFNLPECVQWFLNYKAEQKKGGNPDSDDARTALAWAQKDRVDLDVAERRGQLLERETVGMVLNEMGSIFSTGLDAIAPRLANDLAGIEDPRHIQELLQDESRNIRLNTAKAIESFSANFNPSGDSQATT